jgi:CBS domain-containing protein
MTSVPVLDASTTIQDASAAMLDKHVETAIVIDGRKLRGLVTARDIADGLGDRDVGSSLVLDIAHPDPLVVDHQDVLAEAHEEMRAADAVLAVVTDDDGRPVGVLGDHGATV